MPKFRLPRKFRDLLHAANLRHGTDGFTSPPKEGVLRIFFALKIRRLRPGLNPQTRVLKASTLPLDHRSREGLCQSKVPMTPTGIEPATSRLVAQHLNHCATTVPVTPCSFVCSPAVPSLWPCSPRLTARIRQTLDLVAGLWLKISSLHRDMQ